MTAKKENEFQLTESGICKQKRKELFQLLRFFKGNLLSFFDCRGGLYFFSRRSLEMSFCLLVFL
jgi:hypothetical protein